MGSNSTAYNHVKPIFDLSQPTFYFADIAFIWYFQETFVHAMNSILELQKLLEVAWLYKNVETYQGDGYKQL